MATDETANGLRKQAHELLEPVYRALESGTPGVDGSDDALILEDDVPHPACELRLSGSPRRRNAGHDVNTIRAEQGECTERHVGHTDRFDDDVDIANGLAELIERVGP